MPEPSMETVCRECKYSEMLSATEGICHRFPPLPHVLATDVPRQPAVRPDTDWCGEFIRRHD